MNVAPSSLLCTSAVVLGGSWTPANLSNKVGWWRASDITGKVDGDSVTAWPDSFGLLSDATGTGTYRTGVNGIGGVQAVEFNGSSDYYSTGYAGTPTDYFAWVVIERNSTISTARAFLDKNFADGFSLRENLTADQLRFVHRTTFYDISPPSTTLWMAMGHNGINLIRHYNSVTASSTLSTSALSTSTMTIGARYNVSGFFDGKIAEAGFLDGYPSASDLTNLRTYITDTYGITTS